MREQQANQSVSSLNLRYRAMLFSTRGLPASGYSASRAKAGWISTELSILYLMTKNLKYRARGRALPSGIGRRLTFLHRCPLAEIRLRLYSIELQ